MIRHLVKYWLSSNVNFLSISLNKGSVYLMRVLETENKICYMLPCMLCFFVQDDLENFSDVGSLEDNVESFLTHDGGDGNIYGTLKTLTEHKTEPSKSNLLVTYTYLEHFIINETSFIQGIFVSGFSFGEVGCIRTRNKVLCCHFSSDGKLLASAGHEKKVECNARRRPLSL